MLTRYSKPSKSSKIASRVRRPDRPRGSSPAVRPWSSPLRTQRVGYLNEVIPMRAGRRSLGWSTPRGRARDRGQWRTRRARAASVRMVIHAPRAGLVSSETGGWRASPRNPYGTQMHFLWRSGELRRGCLAALVDSAVRCTGNNGSSAYLCARSSSVVRVLRAA